MDIRRIDAILKNNSGIKSKETLISSFVIREQPFRYVISELEKGSKMNHLIIGQRGAGKTTLLHRIGYGKTSMIFTSQLPVSAWFEMIGEKTIADAVLDRIVHDAHRIEALGESMRKVRPKKLEDLENTFQ